MALILSSLTILFLNADNPAPVVNPRIIAPQSFAAVEALKGYIEPKIKTELIAARLQWGDLRPELHSAEYHFENIVRTDPQAKNLYLDSVFALSKDLPKLGLALDLSNLNPSDPNSHLSLLNVNPIIDASGKGLNLFTENFSTLRQVYDADINFRFILGEDFSGYSIKKEASLSINTFFSYDLNSRIGSATLFHEVDTHVANYVALSEGKACTGCIFIDNPPNVYGYKNWQSVDETTSHIRHFRTATNAALMNDNDPHLTQEAYKIGGNLNEVARSNIELGKVLEAAVNSGDPQLVGNQKFIDDSLVTTISYKNADGKNSKATIPLPNLGLAPTRNQIKAQVMQYAIQLQAEGYQGLNESVEGMKLLHSEGTLAQESLNIFLAENTTRNTQFSLTTNAEGLVLPPANSTVESLHRAYVEVDGQDFMKGVEETLGVRPDRVVASMPNSVNTASDPTTHGRRQFVSTFLEPGSNLNSTVTGAGVTEPFTQADTSGNNSTLTEVKVNSGKTFWSAENVAKNIGAPALTAWTIADMVSILGNGSEMYNAAQTPEAKAMAANHTATQMNNYVIGMAEVTVVVGGVNKVATLILIKSGVSTVVGVGAGTAVAGVTAAALIGVGVGSLINNTDGIRDELVSGLRQIGKDCLSACEKTKELVMAMIELQVKAHKHGRPAEISNIFKAVNESANFAKGLENGKSIDEAASSLAARQLGNSSCQQNGSCGVEATKYINQSNNFTSNPQNNSNPETTQPTPTTPTAPPLDPNISLVAVPPSNSNLLFIPTSPSTGAIKELPKTSDSNIIYTDDLPLNTGGASLVPDQYTLTYPIEITKRDTAGNALEGKWPDGVVGTSANGFLVSKSADPFKNGGYAQRAGDGTYFAMDVRTAPLDKSVRVDTLNLNARFSEQVYIKDRVLYITAYKYSHLNSSGQPNVTVTPPFLPSPVIAPAYTPVDIFDLNYTRTINPGRATGTGAVPLNMPVPIRGIPLDQAYPTRSITKTATTGL